MFAGTYLRRRSGMSNGVQALLALLAVLFLGAGLHRQPVSTHEALPPSANVTATAAFHNGCDCLSHASIGGGSPVEALNERFLSFNVCGDWATQRVALLSGEWVLGRCHVDDCLTSGQQGVGALAMAMLRRVFNQGLLQALIPAAPCPTPYAGMALAAETNRTVVLPQLLLDGRAFEFG